MTLRRCFRRRMLLAVPLLAVTPSAGGQVFSERADVLVVEGR